VLVTARLVNEAGSPLAGAELVSVSYPESQHEDSKTIRDFLLGIGGEEVPDSPLWAAAADEEGQVQLRIPEPSQNWVVLGRMRSHRMSYRQVEAVPGKREYDLGDLELPPAASFTALVVDPNGRPRAGVPVMAMVTDFEDMQQNEMPFHLRLTGEDGRCRMDHLKAGPIQLSAKPKGAPSTSLPPFELELGENPERRLVLGGTGQIRVQVMEASGTPAAGARVLATADSEHRSMFGDLMSQFFDDGPVTGEDGMAVLADLDPGLEYEVHARRGESLRASQDEVRVGDSITLQLPLACGIRGRLLTDGGQPAAGAQLGFPEPGDRWIAGNRRLEASADGGFSAELVEGAYHVVARHETGEAVFHEPGSIEGPVDLGELRLRRGGRLVVRVVAAADGSPVENFRLEEIEPLAAGEEETEPLSSIDRSLASLGYGGGEEEDGERDRRLLSLMRPPAALEGDGARSWDGLRPGPFRVQASAEGYVRAAAQVVIEGGKTAEARIELRAAAELLVTLRHADGRLATGWDLLLRKEGEDQDDSPWGPGSTFRETDDQGQARFSSLEPGSYLLNDGKDYNIGEPLGRFELAAGEQEVEAVLGYRHQLLVSVTDADGPVAEATVRVHALREQEIQRHFLGGFSTNHNTGDDGTVVFEDLPSGKYQVTVERPNGLSVTAGATLPGQGAVHVHLSGVPVSGRLAGVAAGDRLRVNLYTAAPDPEIRELIAENPELAEFLREGAFGGNSTRVTSEPNGSFRFEDVPPGNYVLQPDGGGYYCEAPAEIEVGADPVTDVVIPCAAEGRLSLQVMNMPDDRYFNCVVTREGGPGARKWIHRDGHYGIHGLAPGNYMVQIRERDSDERVLAEWPVEISAGYDTNLDWQAPGQ